MSRSFLSLDRYVTVTENNSNNYSAEEIVTICKRKNNSKRDFIFVNNLQGKHIHVEPQKTFILYDELVSEIIKHTSSNEKIVVIGFAETATAIGHYIASSLPNCNYYMQTTREIISNEKILLEFQEEHSHATEQLLYGDISKLEMCDRIIFVDDEISTGNTVLNFIHEIEKLGIHVKFTVASLLNWQDDEWTSKFRSMNISTYFILRGKLKNINAKVNVSPIAEVYEPVLQKELPVIIEAKNDISNYYKERIGSKPYTLSEVSENVYSSISSVLKNKLPIKGEKVLVLGTEEYMFAPMVFAKMLGEKTGANVHFHATTRSPIETADAIEYAIKERYSITSCYDDTRRTYIYNLGKYDKVYIVTDVIPNPNFIKDIYSALVHAGCNEKIITIITMKG